MRKVTVLLPGYNVARHLEALVANVASIEAIPGWAREAVPVFWANGPRSLPAKLAPRV